MFEIVEGIIIIIIFIVVEWGYEGGVGYCVVKFGERVVVEVLCLELCGYLVWVCEVSFGMVYIEEFFLVCFYGD